ncbi:hypothetical protein DERP_000960 [Dermatophagoides pteronyssinus]|uniref:Major facilitator superfamily (MFS) profile domain-containing protein n=1 Tax=Dermatophagoides pteronyssinus TaxID=6956 RepID=A0ABQ8JD48_DERPT|nr:hypothetical protein DERP_000960 [Dermatophagoides pteronyssinus]
MSTRMIIGLLGMYACALLFMYRAGVSVALVYMTQQSKLSTLNRTTTEIIDQYFDWNQNKQGTILGSSFYLYWCLPTIIGSFTDRYGGQWFAFIGIIGPCILSAITPLAVDYYQDFALIIIQIMIGGFHAFTYPAWFSLFSKWFYGNERTQANSWMQIGNAIGCSAMYLLAGHLCTLSKIGWHLIFYVMAILHLPWIVLWLWYGSDDPLENKRISDMELQFIQQKVSMPFTISKSKKNTIRQTPWLKILISPVVWSSVICKMCCAFGFFLILNKMPSYFAIVFELTIEENGLISALVVFAFGIGSFISPILCNFFIKHFQISPLLIRKISQNIAMVGPAICLLGITHYHQQQQKCSQNIVFALLIIAMFLHGFFTSGEWTIVSEYSRNYTGSIVGFAHSLAFLMGIIGPWLVGLVFESSSTSTSSSFGETAIEKWNFIFYITTAIYLFGNMIFTIFGTDQQQEWDKI